MVKPSFNAEDIEKLSQNFLIKLFESTGGDEWEERPIENIYSEIDNKTYDLTNIALRNNVLQYLLAHERIAIDADRTLVSITFIGKQHYYHSH